MGIDDLGTGPGVNFTFINPSSFHLSSPIISPTPNPITTNDPIIIGTRSGSLLQIS